jgi:hypothetical protein
LEGQVALFRAFDTNDQSNNFPQTFVAQHFADINYNGVKTDNSSKAIVTVDLKVRKAGNPYEPVIELTNGGFKYIEDLRSCFAPPTKELLLYLGLFAHDPFRSGQSRLSARNAVAHANKHSRVVSHYNSNVNSNDGNEMEDLLAIAMCTASHRDGLAGVKGLFQYVRYLLEELMPGTVSDVALTLQAVEKMVDAAVPSLRHWSSNVDNIIVPYMSPINAKWPDDLTKINGVRVANLTRPVNAAQRDIVVGDCHIAGECKDRQQFGGNEFISVLERQQNHNDILTFLLCRKMSTTLQKLPCCCHHH